MSTIQERVAKGAEFMDDKAPNWAENIDCENFDIGVAHGCVLGQTFGDYWEAKNNLGLSDQDAFDLGFNTWFDGYAEPDWTSHASLHKAWLAEIAKRV